MGKGKAIHRKGRCLVPWTKACKSKKEGGLGILDLKAHNKALLLKFADTPWVRITWQALYSNQVAPHVKRLVGSFWWHDVMSLSFDYRGLAVAELVMVALFSLERTFGMPGSLNWNSLSCTLLLVQSRPSCPKPFLLIFCCHFLWLLHSSFRVLWTNSL